jgi:hypothetical protein
MCLIYRNIGTRFKMTKILLILPPQKKTPARTVGCNFYFFLFLSYGLGQLSRYSTSLRAWRSRDRIPVGSEISSPIQTDPGPIQSSIQWVPGVKRPQCGVDHSPTYHLAPGLKKEYSYTSTPPVGCRGLF